MKKFLSILFLFCSVGCVAPLIAQSTLSPGGGLTMLNTSTYIGAISSSNTLSLDLVTAYVADIEMDVVNVDTNEVVYVYTINGISTPQPMNGLQPCIDITDIPAGNYRVDLYMLVPDYWGYVSMNTWWQATNYFDPYSGYGGCYIDVGASESDVWSWGGAGLILW